PLLADSDRSYRLVTAQSGDVLDCTFFDFADLAAQPVDRNVALAFPQLDRLPRIQVTPYGAGDYTFSLSRAFTTLANPFATAFQAIDQFG
ncbi:hypothetical protein ACFWFQ_32015, partial [Nocardia salmonicida]|uniref:hypothetical protein n=1 Tax=Nocardia salmonicida TaxID=53431 RepID=UPI0036564F34